MKLFFHSSVSGSNNCYILGTEADDERQTALIIDPGHIDQKIIDFIEDNDYTPGGILVTHDHLNHVRGIGTLMRLYSKTPIFALNPTVADHKTTMIRDGDTFSIPPFRITAYSVPGHATDAIIYRIGNMLFTGDALSAGLVGRTFGAYAAKIQMNALQSKIFSLPGDFAIFPGHGPLSSLDAERHCNAGARLHSQNERRETFFMTDVEL
jgi:glyoxylase-like metal-dependent hydrolase (beta-lactamase superfamily II)